MSAANEGCSWYVIIESDEEDCQTHDEEHAASSSSDVPATANRGVSFSNPVTAVNGTSSRVSVVSWNINEGLQVDDSSHPKNVGGMRKASVAMATGLAGIQSPNGVELVSQVIVSTPGQLLVADRQSSTLKELHNVRKHTKRNGQVSIKNFDTPTNSLWRNHKPTW